ncbi:MAG: PrsW family intramembrane metalloprotease [Candidatus Aureabacteria bacterium]|nr:PrsW family intramembrane metalloprotease [Candidatus Auribacterota bacterium]
MGIFVSIPAIAIEWFCVVVTQLMETQTTIFITAFFVIAPLEEYLKSLAVDIAGYSKNEEGNPRQILAWYFSAAIGFASIENMLYYFVFGPHVFFYRILISTIAHIACSGIIGYFIGTCYQQEHSGFFRGFFLALLLHGIYDFSLKLFPNSLWFWVPVFILIVCFLERKLEGGHSPSEEETPEEQKNLKESE